MDIKCRKTICKHNKGQCCFACCVDIDKNTVCKSYDKNIEKENEKNDFSKRMFESAPEYENFRHIKNVFLNCEAKDCIFNNDGKCRANGITIIDDNEKSSCATYLFEE